MFKEHVYHLATRLIEETTLDEIRRNIMDFTDKDYAWFESELNMLENYTELFDGLICKSSVSNNSNETTISEEERNSGGVMNSVFSYLSSFFKNNSSLAVTEKRPNKPTIRDGKKSFKLIMLGDYYVGKTSTLDCAVKNKNCNQKKEMPPF